MIVSLADGGQSRVSWLVGCDGAHSRVRQLAGVGFPGVPLAERFLLVDVHADLPLSRHSIYVWLDGDSVFGAFPLPVQDLWRLMAPAADPGAEADLVTDEAVLAEVARLLGNGLVAIHRSFVLPSGLRPSGSTAGSPKRTVTAGSCSPVTPPMSTARSAVKV